MKAISKISAPLFVALIAGLLALPKSARADGLTSDEQAFFDKHASDVVQLRPARLNDPSFLKVFAAPFYTVKVVMKQGDSEESTDIVVARIEDKLVSVSRPGTDTDLPDFPKLLNPSFKIQSDDDAKALQAALDLAYPIVGDDDKKAAGFRRAGTQWIFVRGKFFDHFLGYIFDVDPSGAVKSVKFTLKLP